MSADDTLRATIATSLAPMLSVRQAKCAVTFSSLVSLNGGEQVNAVHKDRGWRLGRVVSLPILHSISGTHSIAKPRFLSRQY